MNNKTLSCDITEDLTCPVCGVKIDSTEIPWSQLNNYVEFECIECEHKIWAEWQPYVLIGKVDPFAEKTTEKLCTCGKPVIDGDWCEDHMPL